VSTEPRPELAAVVQEIHSQLTELPEETRRDLDGFIRSRTAEGRTFGSLDEFLDWLAELVSSTSTPSP
jgi:hypothetical protein